MITAFYQKVYLAAGTGSNDCGWSPIDIETPLQILCFHFGHSLGHTSQRGLVRTDAARCDAYQPVSAALSSRPRDARSAV
jgi:hypothetical protein